jgi:signal transduction histidine kinase
VALATPSRRIDAVAAGRTVGRGVTRRRPTLNLRSFLRRLDVRLVATLGSLAVASLLVSGLALYQILPGYFVEQAEKRLQSASVAAALYVQDQAASVAQRTPNVLLQREVREGQFLAQTAQTLADRFVQATVEFYNADGTLASSASPTNGEALRANGLRVDTGVDPQQTQFEIPMPFLNPPLQLVVRVSDPYTSRVATLDAVRTSLIGAGLLALLVSLMIGMLVARRLTRPIDRVRRVSARLAQGQLDERVPPSGVMEVDELAQQFNVMADRLSRSLRMLEADRDRLREFVADVSHELRTPIAALRTFTDLQREGDVDASTRAEFLDRSTEQINRLEWLSTNLLDLSRIDAGIFPLDMHWGDLRDPLGSVVEAHAEVAEARGVALSSTAPSTPVSARFDRERMVQLMSNLVGNALKFTPRGGEVSVRLSDTTDEAIIEVSDNGPGIPPGELPRIFDRFYRGTNVGEARASGSGLGLAISRSIVEMHGGSIEVASVEGEGATFVVRLPHRPPTGEQG